MADGHSAVSKLVIDGISDFEGAPAVEQKKTSQYGRLIGITVLVGVGFAAGYAFHASAPMTNEAAYEGHVTNRISDAESEDSNPTKVSILGACSALSQPLLYGLMQSPMISHLSLWDIRSPEAVAVDLNAMPTKISVVEHYMGMPQLADAVRGSGLVVSIASMPRQPGMTSDDLFNTNAAILKEISNSVAQNSPDAFFILDSDPLDSMLPLVAEAFKARGVLNPNKLMGATLWPENYLVRRIAIDHHHHHHHHQASLPFVGGGSGSTIVPLLSQMVPKTSFTDAEIETYTEEVRSAESKLVEATMRTNAGPVGHISHAYAVAALVHDVLEAATQGRKGVVADVFGIMDNLDDVDYGVFPALLGQHGIERNLFSFDTLSDLEKQQLHEAIPLLKGHIKKGVQWFANNQ